MMRRDMDDILKGRPDTQNHEYKNPALYRIDGVLTSSCVKCGKLIDDEYTTKDWYKFIRQEYCENCREEIRREQNRSRQLRYRRSKRQLKKDYEQQTNLLKQENRLLREVVMALRDDVEQLKTERL